MSRDRVRQYVDVDGSDVMELDDVCCSDADDYMVTASNELGSCSATATLVVQTTTPAAAAPLEHMYTVLRVVNITYTDYCIYLQLEIVAC